MGGEKASRVLSLGRAEVEGVFPRRAPSSGANGGRRLGNAEIGLTGAIYSLQREGIGERRRR